MLCQRVCSGRLQLSLYLLNCFEIPVPYLQVDHYKGVPARLSTEPTRGSKYLCPSLKFLGGFDRNFLLSSLPLQSVPGRCTWGLKRCPSLNCARGGSSEVREWTMVSTDKWLWFLPRKVCCPIWEWCCYQAAVSSSGKALALSLCYWAALFL